MLCLKLLPQLSSNLNDPYTSYTWSICCVDVHAIIYVRPVSKGFQSYAPFFKTLTYISITMYHYFLCQSMMGVLLITISDSSSFITQQILFIFTYKEEAFLVDSVPYNIPYPSYTELRNTHIPRYYRTWPTITKFKLLINTNAESCNFSLSCFQKEKLTTVIYQLCTNIMHYIIM